MSMFKSRNNNQQFPADLLLLSTSDENGICYVKMLGACQGCGSIDTTLSDLIEAFLLEEVEGVIGVELVSDEE